MMLGNYFVTVQDNQVGSAASGRKKSQLPTVKKVVQPKYPVGKFVYVFKSSVK
jgi:hypothetical protein